MTESGGRVLVNDAAAPVTVLVLGTSVFGSASVLVVVREGPVRTVALACRLTPLTRPFSSTGRLTFSVPELTTAR